MTSVSALSSVCCSRITSAVTTDRPASIIVANWREKICSDFGFTFVLMPMQDLPVLSACSADLLDPLGQEAVPRSASRAADRSVAWISPLSSTPWALMAL